MAPQQRPRWLRVLVVLALVATAVFCCVAGAIVVRVAIEQGRQSAQRRRAENMLRQIREAVETYNSPSLPSAHGDQAVPQDGGSTTARPGAATVPHPN